LNSKLTKEMSSSQTTPFPQDLSDKIMMETPDSPPDAPGSSVDPLLHSPGSSQQAHASTSTVKSTSDSAAKVNHGPPGSSWSSKKAHEDYDRAYNILTDQSWDPSKYGDPLLK